MSRFLVLLSVGCALLAVPQVLPGGAKGHDKKDEAKPGLPKTSHNGVDYEVLSSKMVGNNWELTLSALAQVGGKKKKFSMGEARSITEDGKVHLTQDVLKGSMDLPPGQKIQLKLNMGPLPDSFSKFSAVEIYVRGSTKERLVLKNVRVDR